MLNEMVRTFDYFEFTMLINILNALVIHNVDYIWPASETSCLRLYKTLYIG